jgi:Na+/H+-dicarboxylate symporter
MARRLGLMHYTAIAFFLGVIVGLVLLQVPSEQRAPVLDWMKALGDIFIRL